MSSYIGWKIVDDSADDGTLLVESPQGHRRRVLFEATMTERLAAAEARVAELSRVDWYWDEDHLECAIPVDEAGENNSTGDILELRPVHEMQKVWMLITDDGMKIFDTLEEAEREQEAM
jgi:hypothetical protein